MRRPADLPRALLVLGRQCAYDEVIGQPLREACTRLEAPLSLEYPE